jgi:hypothetical protein
MIRKKRPVRAPLVVDITGPDGNAFALMGLAMRLARQLGIDSTSIVKEMKSGDYENLIQVFDRNFGSIVILER